MAKVAALIPGVVESSPNSIWRSRVSTTAKQAQKEEPRTLPWRNTMNNFKIQLLGIIVRVFTSGIAAPTQTLKISIRKKIEIVFGFHGNCTTSHFFQCRWNGIKRGTNCTLNNRTFNTNPAIASLTYRSPNGKETTFYLRAKWHLIDFNSEHVASRFGKSTEAPFGEYHVYEGILGRHVAM